MARTQTNRQVKRLWLQLKHPGIALAQFESVGRDTSSSLLARILHVGGIQFESQRFHLVALDQTDQQFASIFATLKGLL